MDIYTLDFETHWAKDYTLTRMSPLAYVMDDRFELISLALKKNGDRTRVVFGETRIREVLKFIDWSKAAMLAHNMSGFDSYIVAYRLGIVPRMWLCTLAMARPIHEKTTGLSLAKLVEHYELGVKNNAVLIQTQGKRLADFTLEERTRMETYNRDDTDQCWALFNILKQHYTPSELWQIDALTRLRTEPAFDLDFGLLETALSVERSNKHKALMDVARRLRADGAAFDNWDDEEAVAEFVRGELSSQPKFAAMLVALGAEVPTKPSPTDGDKLIPALAKDDEGFIELLEHEDERVAALAMARMGIKSTITETRIEKFMEAGRHAGGRLPIPIKYCGAVVSGRDSGEEYNPQNMNRVGKVPKPSDALRNSLVAPPGYSVIVADQSGIEMRTSHTLAQVEESMALWQQSPTADLYRAFGATRYGCPPEEVNGERRQASKIAQLQLQFGSGAKTYLQKARIQGGLRDMELPEAEMVVQAWRSKYFAIVDMWSRAGEALRHIQTGSPVQIDPWGLMVTCPEGVRLTASGRLIRYPDLRYLNKDAVIHEFFKGSPPNDEKKLQGLTGWWYGKGRHRARIYGAKVFQNGTQAIARDSIFDCSIQFYKQTGRRFNLRTHDELAYVVPTPKAEGLLEQLQKILRTSPTWFPELVTWSEGGVAQTYGAAK
jgi:DNA polymerase